VQLIRPTVRSLMQLVCIMLLLAAQHSALTHQFAHLQNDSAVTLQQRSDDSTRVTHSALCDYHGALAEVLGCVASAAVRLGLTSNGGERDVGFSASASPVTPVVPAARGPPLLF